MCMRFSQSLSPGWQVQVAGFEKVGFSFDQIGFGASDGLFLYATT